MEKMKKTYEAPVMEQVVVGKPTLLAGSTFTEGETGSSGTGAGTVDPSQGL